MKTAKILPHKTFLARQYKENVPGVHSLMPLFFNTVLAHINELPNINSQMLGGQTKVLISFPGHSQILSQSGNEATKYHFKCK